MKLWLISQTVNNGYDTYDSAVVAAETREEARLTHPSKSYIPDVEDWGSSHSAWADPKDIVVVYLGMADQVTPGVICSSFNAG